MKKILVAAVACASFALGMYAASPRSQATPACKPAGEACKEMAECCSDKCVNMKCS
ncbi:MAG: hypothetical protein IT381_22050 [Deltaproteobacteria bacterium]|nr:hypothetical protein [Deltaproteobacteria bacterium]